MTFNNKQKKIICGVIAVCMVVPIVVGVVVSLIPA